MKRLRLTLLALTALAFSLATSAQAQTTAKEHEVIKLEREMASGFRNGDFSAFERYTPDDFTATVAAGQLVTKQQIHQFFKNNKHESLDLDDLAVRSYGDVAVVTGRVHQKGTTGQKEGLHIQARFTSVWAKMNGRWMQVARHFSDSPPKTQ